VKKIVDFLKDCLAELKKVVWPGRDEVIASTKVVFVSTFIIACVFGLVDFLFVLGFDFVF